MLDVIKIREDFPMFRNNPDLIYFDSAATAFKPQSVIDEVLKFYTHETSNVHRGDYALSYKVSQAYEEARATMAHFIGAKSEEIVFTAGASASLNLLAYGYGGEFLQEGDIILTTEAEHASNLLPWFRMAEIKKAHVRYIPLESDGTFSLANLKAVMNEKVKIVALAAVTNVLGYRLPISEISKIVHQYPAVLAVDGAQSVPHHPTDVQTDGIDFLSFSAHKMGGPSGVGVLYGKWELLNSMNPLYLGGGSNARFDQCGHLQWKNTPHKFESGTPNIEGVLGMAAAARYLQRIGLSEIADYGRKLNAYFAESMAKLENVQLYNPHAESGIVTFNVKGIFAQDVAAYLSTRNIAVRAGNHCAKILNNIIGSSTTVRASLYLYNTKEEIDRFVQEVQDISLDKCIGVIL